MGSRTTADRRSSAWVIPLVLGAPFSQYIPLVPVRSRLGTIRTCCVAEHAVPYASRARGLGSLAREASVSLTDAENAILDELQALNARLEADERMSDCDRKGFALLLARFLVERLGKGSASQPLDWSTIQLPGGDVLVPYDEMATENAITHDGESARQLLSKLAVLKLNGGLGTSMGCVGPKSSIQVRDDNSFLDLTVRQVAGLNHSFSSNVPLLLMNSFNTHDETEKILAKYLNTGLKIHRFYQSRYPRIARDTLSLLSTEHYVRRPDSKRDGEGWYPPGHGDLWSTLSTSGLLDSLLDQGRKYLFVSNIDNLGATVDLNILSYMERESIGFAIEVTDKTMADVKGGTLIISPEGKLKLLEIAQVPKQHIEEFKSIRKFRVFNTNNMWVNLHKLKEVLRNPRDIQPDLIVNRKSMTDGTDVIQLETAAGQIIQHFEDARGINVPRSRFLPVKTTSDLFVVQSNLYTVADNGQLSMNSRRQHGANPLVKLGEHYAKIDAYNRRLGNIPDIVELEHLTVSGDVTFGRDVTLRGTVIIVANPGSHIDIPSGAILENKVVSGNLNILDH